MGALKCLFGTVPTTCCGLSPLALGRTWKGLGTLVDLSQVPNGCPHFLKSINWAPLGLGPGYHLFPVSARGTAFLLTLATDNHGPSFYGPQNNVRHLHNIKSNVENYHDCYSLPVIYLPD